MRVRACAEINSHFAAGPQARWLGASSAQPLLRQKALHNGWRC